MTGERWLVTGGAGFIGAHVVRALVSSGRDAVVLDDLSTGTRSRVPDGVDLVEGTVTDTGFLADVIRRTAPAGVVHCAGKKSPTESMRDPLLYARENVGGVISLAEAAVATGLRRVLFSSSCSVYGTPPTDSVDEQDLTVPVSPYGESKLYGERLLTAAAEVHGWGLINLRYFNVVGAAAPDLRDSGAYNLVPLVLQALREGRRCTVFGTDYDTPDGTCVRDYLDVEDLADAHLAAVRALEAQPRIATYNVGRGRGSSVLDVLDAVSQVAGLEVPREFRPRRAGDPARIVGRVAMIERELGWRATRDLPDMVGAAWRAEQRAGGSAAGGTGSSN